MIAETQSRGRAPVAPRLLGPVTGTALVAGSMLGVGIFLFPPEVATHVASKPFFLLLWVLGGVVALAGAAAYGELGAMFPRAGGDYVFVREAFGDAAAFASGWVLVIGVFTGSIASMAMGLADYQLPVLYGALGGDPQVLYSEYVLGPLRFTGSQPVAIGLVLLVTSVNALGLRSSALVQLMMTSVPVLVYTVFAAWVLGTGPVTPITAAEPAAIFADHPIVALVTAFLSIYFAYAGWNAVAYVGGEVAQPERNIPIALIFGTILITALYVLLCSTFLAVLGIEGLSQAGEAGTATALAVLGADAGTFVAALIAMGLLGALNGTTLAGARISQAMAVDRALPATLAKLSPHTHVPARALWLQAGAAIVLIATGTFETLVQLTSIAMMLLGTLAVLALFRLRRREPAAVRHYRALGYPVLPAFYIAVGVVVLVASVWRAARHIPDEGWNAAIPLLGLVIFAALFFGRRIARRPSAGPGR